MTKPKKKGSQTQSKSNVNVKTDGIDATKPANENCDLRTAIVDVLMNDDAVMQPLIDAVTEGLVAKLLSSTNFISSLAYKLESIGALGYSSTLENVRQDVYESCKMGIDKSVDSIAAMQAQIASMERTQQSLTDEIDELESTAGGTVSFFMVGRRQFFYSQYDSRYVGCHWLRFAPFLCTNLIGQGPELLTTPAAIKICGDC